MSDRALLLQGPVGPFFSLLADELTAEGQEVFKIHFNGGDEACFAHGNGHRYTGDLAGWPEFLTGFLQRNGIDRIFLFGDCRPYHQHAIRVAREWDVAVFVFEEGYVRPDYITLESGGVNGHSSLSRDPATYQTPLSGKPETPEPAGSGFWPVARQAMRYYLAAWRRRKLFPHYQHHRPLNPLREGLCWLRSVIKKGYFLFADRALNRRLAERTNQYYLVPLQVHCDAQVTHHSGGLTVESFISRTIQSFAEHAPAGTELVFKHHPMDRAYHNHGGLIRKLAVQNEVAGRVDYLHEGHLPTLLKGARGTVTVNSTVGLSSALHRTPVKTVGHAVYDMPGLTHQGSLDAFWREPGEVDYRLYQRYRQYLVDNVLGNGSFYRRVRTDLGATGVRWPFGSLAETIGALAGTAEPAGPVPASQPVATDGVASVSAVASAAEQGAEEQAGPVIDWIGMPTRQDAVYQSAQ